MATKIQWTDETHNFWVGCQKVSAGCKFCYMFREYEGRFKNDASLVRRTSDKTFYKTYKGAKKIFTCSWSDFFIKEADQWRNDAWRHIKEAPEHNWQILTKRPECIAQCLPDDWGEGYQNVWIGISAEDQESLETRLIYFEEFNARVKFLSLEPLIGKIDLTLGFNNLVDWVIVGGESGNKSGPYKYRPCELDWIRQIVKDCTNEKVPVFVKQYGTYIASKYGLKDQAGGDIKELISQWTEFDFDKIREFPTTKTLV